LLHSCNKCNNVHYLTVENISVLLNDKGEVQESKETIISNLVLNKEAFDKIKNMNNAKTNINPM